MSDSAPVEADDSVRWLREKYVAWAIEKYADIADELERSRAEIAELRKDLHGGPALTHAFRLERNEARAERDAARAEVERLNGSPVLVSEWHKLRRERDAAVALVTEAYFSGRQSVSWGKRAVELGAIKKQES